MITKLEIVGVSILVVLWTVFAILSQSSLALPYQSTLVIPENTNKAAIMLDGSSITTNDCLTSTTPLKGLTIHGPFNNTIDFIPLTYYPAKSVEISIWLDNQLLQRLPITGKKPYPKFSLTNASFAKLFDQLHVICFQVKESTGMVNKYPVWAFKTQ